MTVAEKQELYRLDDQQYKKFLTWKRSFDFGQCAVVRALLRTRKFKAGKRKDYSDRIRTWLASPSNQPPLSDADYKELGVPIINKWYNKHRFK